MLTQLVHESAVASIRSVRKVISTYSEPELQNQVDTRGYCLVHGYWSRGQCTAAVSALERLMADESLHDPTVASPGDTRIFGVNNFDPCLDFFSDPRVTTIISELYQVKEQDLMGATMGNRISAVTGNLGSGGGWHRDSAAVDQYKSFVYLSDVDDDNGPLQYVEGSASQAAFFKGYLARDFSVGQTRFEGEAMPVSDRSHSLQTIVAPAGTLIIANTRGIHRGAPLLRGVRYALTNYYFAGNVPAHVKELIRQPGS